MLVEDVNVIKKINRGFTEITMFFGDLVIGPEYSESEKKTQLFNNHEVFTFMLNMIDLEEWFKELRLALFTAHHLRAKLTVKT